jgi:hypothetical protein
VIEASILLQGILRRRTIVSGKIPAKKLLGLKTRPLPGPFDTFTTRQGNSVQTARPPAANRWNREFRMTENKVKNPTLGTQRVGHPANHVLDFYQWLEQNHPTLLRRGHGDPYQHLMADLSNHMKE